MEKNIYRKQTNRLSTKRTNWEGYQKEMDSYFDTLLDSNTPVLDKYKNFTEKMIQAIANNTPVRKAVNNLVHRNPIV